MKVPGQATLYERLQSEFVQTLDGEGVGWWEVSRARYIFV